jgi:hypothetical protein
MHWLLKISVDLLISLPEIGIAGTRDIVRKVTKVEVYADSLKTGQIPGYFP